jgi:hypothetical protein
MQLYPDLSTYDTQVLQEHKDDSMIGRFRA